MAVRELIIYPDPRLRLKAVPTINFDAALSEAVQDVIDTLQAVSAIGLTAVHIGRSERIAVIRATLDSPPIAYVNPRITLASSERSLHLEGSVSMPGISDRVERANRVVVRYADCTGAEHDVDADGFFAACFQHEIDQLDGLFWINRLTRLRRERAIKLFAKRQRAAV